MKTYGFIVDTNKYPGNFERELCAYMTGHIGDCGKGAREVEEYIEDGFQPLENIIYKPDDHGTFRPVALYITPNMWNNGMGFEYAEGQEELALSKYKQSIEEYYNQHIQRVEGNRGKNYDTWTDDAINNEIRRYKDTIAEAYELKEVKKYPAYMSIIIYLDKQPTPEEIKFLKERTEKYTLEYNTSAGIKIINYRLAEIKIVETIINI